MKTSKLSYVLISALIYSCAFSSCSNDDNENIPQEGTPVEKIEASINFNLASRSDWTLSMGGYIYDFEINENKLIGTPKNEPFHFSYGQKETNGATEVILRAPSVANRLNYTPPPIPPTADQSTMDRFIRYDMLVGRYIGNVSEELTNIKFVHYYALLDFKVANLPEDANVYILQGNKQKITPLQDKQDPKAYKAIVWANNKYEDILVIIETPAKTYSNVLRESVKETRSLAYHFDGIGNGSIVNFTARIDAEDKLVIEDLAREYWAEEWPINQ